MLPHVWISHITVQALCPNPNWSLTTSIVLIPVVNNTARLKAQLFFNRSPLLSINNGLVSIGWKYHKSGKGLLALIERLLIDRLLWRILCLYCQDYYSGMVWQWMWGRGYGIFRVSAPLGCCGQELRRGHFAWTQYDEQKTTWSINIFVSRFLNSKQSCKLMKFDVEINIHPLKIIT